MKNRYFKLSIIILSLLFFNNCQQKINMEKITSITESVKNIYAPDKRVAIFNITAKSEVDSIILSGESNISEGVTELINELEKLNFMVKNEINILPAKNLGNKIFGIVNLSVANVRSKPEHPAELATQSLLGTCVHVLKKENGWFLIQTPDKYISWVDYNGIYQVDKDELKNWKDSPKVIITEQYSSAYEQPDKQSQRISDLVIGNILKKITINNGYTEIEFPDGRRGFISSNHLNNYSNWVKQANSDQKSIIETALNYLGLPYLWGGTSSKAFDCSGFTKTVFFLNGVILPRDASQQVNVGKLVNTNQNFDELKPGDLLFFGRRASEEEKEKVTHVAIYIGGYQYVHSSGRVRINSLDKKAEDFNRHRFETFIRAKRIIGSYNKGENLVKNNQFYN